MLEVHQFPCLSDNYGFLLHDPESGETAAIDTPDGSEYLRQAEAKGWEVVFLGAEFARFDDAEAVGVSASKTMAVGQGSMRESMSALAKKSRAYGKGEEAEIIFDDEDRAIADEEGVKQRQGQ